MTLSREARIQATNYYAQLVKLEDKLARIIDEIDSTHETSSTYWADVKRRLGAIYDDMRDVATALVNSEIPAAFTNSVRDAVRDLKASHYTPDPQHFTDIIGTHPIRQSLRSLLEESLTTLNTGLIAGEKTLNQLLRYTQQVNISEKQVNKAIAEGYEEGGPGVRGGEGVGAGSPYGAKLKLQDALMEKAQDGKFISIVDKNGVTRMYNVADYTKMVVRTKLAEASTQGVVSSTLAAGGDLVQVSIHNTLCEECAPYEGKVFSLSGKDEDFPPADELPPYHPNCEHTINATFREGMDVDGTLDDFIAFSNDETEEHPVNDGFVPVSERNLE